MNLLSRLFAMGSMLLAVHAFAADAFEGKVVLTMSTDKGKQTDMSYTLKPGKVRIETSFGGHQSAILTDLAKLETTILMPEQKMYMVKSIKQPAEEAMAGHEGQAANMDLKATGKTDTILGYKAEQIVMTDKEKGTTTEMWVAQGLGTFNGLGGGGGSPFGGPRKQSPTSAKWEEALKGKGGFPLRVVSHDATGKETFKMEATKIEPGPQPDSLFVAPAGYQKLEIPDMSGMMPFKHQ